MVLCKISQPSGLLITEVKRDKAIKSSTIDYFSEESEETKTALLKGLDIDNHANAKGDLLCLLQHNVVNLRPEYCQVYEVPNTLTKEVCK